LVGGDREAKVIGSSEQAPQVWRSQSWNRGYRHSLGGGCVEKRPVAGGHDDAGITDPVGSREVDRVIPAQLTNFGQLASAACEGIIDLDKVDLLEQGVELGHRVAQLSSRETAKSHCLGKGSPHLRVEEPDAHDPIGTVPQRCGASGAGFGDQQRHDR
jgi:hypothetical protein